MITSNAVRPGGVMDCAPERGAKPSVGALLVLAVMGVLIGLAAFGLLDMSVPAPLPAWAAPSVFSAERAMATIRRIAAEPHALGTPAEAQVRDELLGELRSLGYDPQVQAVLAVSREHSVVGYVHNIVTRIPGVAGSGNALMLVAHYDSVPTGPGAADDSASVAAILETLRALRASPRLRNDIIVLLSDGEEVGSLGAEGFMSRYPGAGNIRVALNFEFRGNSGPVVMFETSDGNGRLIDALGSVPHPVANSLMYEIYRLMPNSTDMDVFKQYGLAGMNFAALERPFSYHTALDRPGLLDQGSLQDDGDGMLSLVRYLGDADLASLRADNRIYFDAPGLGLVSYSGSVGALLTATTVLLWVLVVFAGIRNGKIRGARACGAALTLPAVGILMAVAATLLWLGIIAIHPQFRTLPDLYDAPWYRLSFIALATALFVGAQSAQQRWFRPMELAAGAGSFWILLLLGAELAVPGASFILTWPLAPVLLAWLYLLTAAGGRLTETGRLLLLVSAAVPAVILFAPLIYLLFVALGMSLVAVPVFALALLLGILWPLLALLRRNLFFPAVLCLAGVGFLLAGSATSAQSVDHPRQDNLFYLQDCNPRGALWLSTNRALDRWQLPLFAGGAARRRLPELFGAHSRVFWSATAPQMGVRCPEVAVLGDDIRGDARVVRLHVQSRRAAAVLKLDVDGAKVLDARLDGQSVIRTPRTDWGFAAYAMPARGFDLQIVLQARHAFVIRVFDETYGLPAEAQRRRGSDFIAEGFVAHGIREGDTVQALSALSLR